MPQETSADYRKTKLDDYNIRQRLNNISPEKLIDAAEEQLDPEDGLSEREYYIKAFFMNLKENAPVILIGFLFLCIAVNCLITLFNLMQAVIFVESRYLNLNTAYICVSIAAPFLIWYISTAFTDFNYTNRKLFLFKLGVFQICLVISEFAFLFIRYTIIPLFLNLPVTREVTMQMILFLARLVLAIGSIGTLIFVSLKMFSLLDDFVKEQILAVRIRQNHDLRKNTQFSYDMSFIRNLDNAEKIIIKEEDRFLHMDIDGTTGTGKTSSCITTSISDDLDQKLYNEKYLKRTFEKMLSKGQLRVKNDFNDRYFSPAHFEPVGEKATHKYQDLIKKVQNAGITLLAPNASLADDIYELASARGCYANRVDPTLGKDGRHKPGFIGFNPLYIPKDLPPLQRTIEIVNKARTTADVMQALYEMKGSKDAYFTSLNSNLTSSICILVMLTYSRLHKGASPTLIHVQEVVNDFSKAAGYCRELQRMIADTTVSDKERGFSKDTFQFIIDLVKTDLCGPGAEKISEQARGLRTQFSEFLMNPLFKEVLCSENTIDMDKMLRDGEITVVNYALELGRSDATAFGLFFALNFNRAVIRRPVETRIPHFYNIDEFPVLLHSSMEECFTLFRQYKTAMVIAIQNLSQMDKSESTKYLKSVLLGNCGHQIVFGRTSIDEMQYYEKLGGTSKIMMEQNTVSESALSVKDPTMSFSTRSTPTDVANIEGSKMRRLSFQEITLFTVNEGSVVDACYGKVFFLKESKRLKRKRYMVDWSRYYDNETILSGTGTDDIPVTETLKTDVLQPVFRVDIANDSASRLPDNSNVSQSPVRTTGSIFVSGYTEPDSSHPTEEKSKTPKQTVDTNGYFKL